MMSWLGAVALAGGLLGAVACVIQPQPLPPGVTDVGGANGNPPPRDPDGSSDFPSGGGGTLGDASPAASDAGTAPSTPGDDASAADAGIDGADGATEGGARDGGDASHDAALDGG